MDGDPSDLELLLASARQEVATLREDRRLAALPGSRGAALRDHVLDLLGAVDHRIAQQPALEAPQTVRRAFARSLRQSIVVLRGAHAALPWLAATRTPNINLGSLYVTEECARILVGTDVDLVVVPDPEFMYSTTSWPFSAVIESTHGFKPTATRRPIVLNYPLSDSDRLLLHPIFAHELSHASVDEHKLVDAVETHLDAAPAFVKGLQQTVTSMASEWPAPQRRRRSPAPSVHGCEIGLRSCCATTWRPRRWGPPSFGPLRPLSCRSPTASRGLYTRPTPCECDLPWTTSPAADGDPTWTAWLRTSPHGSTELLPTPIAHFRCRFRSFAISSWRTCRAAEIPQRGASEAGVGSEDFSAGSHGGGRPTEAADPPGRPRRCPGTSLHPPWRLAGGAPEER